MHHALRDSLAIEMGEMVNQSEVLNGNGPTGSSGNRRSDRIDGSSRTCRKRGNVLQKKSEVIRVTT